MSSPASSAPFRRASRLSRDEPAKPAVHGQNEPDCAHEHEHDHDHSHSHSHSHTHSLFSAHTHSRDDGPSQDVESIVKVFEGKGDRGSRITVIGLVVNIALTFSKGAAGWYMNSAALLAEAGHSASDLLGDFVTLFAWRLSRRTPSAKYPYGFGKFETLGTTTVSLILIAGALGIGVHSFTLLTHHLLEAAATLPPGPAQALIQNATEVAQSVSNVMHSTSGGILDGHAHAHSHEHALDPNAAWFAAASVLAKEWLFRATRRVAQAENSSVLLANAVHHRADAYTSAVALAAILGTWAFPALPLDPLGGLLVALVVLRQGASLFAGAFGELTDAGAAPRTISALTRALDPIVREGEQGGPLKAVEDVRALRAGALLFVDVRVRVPRVMSMGDAAALEDHIREALLAVRRDVSEVRVKFVPVDDDEDAQGKEDLWQETR